MEQLVHIQDTDISVKEYNGQHDNGLNNRCIYVSLAYDGLVKVGVTKNYSKREKDLSSTEHGKIVKYFVTEKCINAFKVEKMIHEKLKEFNYFGEWYNADFDYIKKVVSGVFSDNAVFLKEIKPKETKARYKCDTMLDYFRRNEVLINE